MYFVVNHHKFTINQHSKLHNAAAWLYNALIMYSCHMNASKVFNVSGLLESWKTFPWRGIASQTQVLTISPSIFFFFERANKIVPLAFKTESVQIKLCISICKVRCSWHSLLRCSSECEGHPGCLSTEVYVSLSAHCRHSLFFSFHLSRAVLSMALACFVPCDYNALSTRTWSP